MTKPLNERTEASLIKSLLGRTPTEKDVQILDEIKNRIRHRTWRIENSKDAFNYLGHIALDRQEHFCVLTLNCNREVIQLHDLYKGTAGKIIIDVKDVYKLALEDDAKGIILAHNHPTGTLDPSDADKHLTQVLYDAGNLLNIPVLDHMIIVKGDYLSFSDCNILGGSTNE